MGPDARLRLQALQVGAFLQAKRALVAGAHVEIGQPGEAQRQGPAAPVALLAVGLARGKHGTRTANVKAVAGFVGGRAGATVDAAVALANAHAGSEVHFRFLKQPQAGRVAGEVAKIGPEGHIGPGNALGAGRAAKLQTRIAQGIAGTLGKGVAGLPRNEGQAKP